MAHKKLLFLPLVVSVFSRTGGPGTANGRYRASLPVDPVGSCVASVSYFGGRCDWRMCSQLSRSAMLVRSFTSLRRESSCARGWLHAQVTDCVAGVSVKAAVLLQRRMDFFLRCSLVAAAFTRQLMTQSRPRPLLLDRREGGCDRQGSRAAAEQTR